MRNSDDKEWMILCTACVKNAWYFNIANLHYEWVGGEMTTSKWKAWYKPLKHLVKQKFIKAYIDHYIPTISNPDLFTLSPIEIPKVDFRRRMCFRATRKGWAEYYRAIKAGRSRPGIAKDTGYWVIEDTRTGETWKEDSHGNRSG